MIQILLIAIISLLAQLVLPWWSIAVVSFLVSLWLSSNAGKAFLFGFLGIALVWLGYALLIHLRSDGAFTGRMSQLILQTNQSALLILLTAVLGGIVGGLAGVAGYYVRQTVRNQMSNPTS